jgi:hypothetical protein
VTDPEAVVQAQLDAYNARDLEALLAIYAHDAEVYEHPAKLVGARHCRPARTLHRPVRRA